MTIGYICISTLIDGRKLFLLSTNFLPNMITWYWIISYNYTTEDIFINSITFYCIPYLIWQELSLAKSACYWDALRVIFQVNQNENIHICWIRRKIFCTKNFFEQQRILKMLRFCFFKMHFWYFGYKCKINEK